MPISNTGKVAPHICWPNINVNPGPREWGEESKSKKLTGDENKLYADTCIILSSAAFAKKPLRVPP
jgi:hypothetical protein